MPSAEAVVNWLKHSRKSQPYDLSPTRGFLAQIARDIPGRSKVMTGIAQFLESRTIDRRGLIAYTTPQENLHYYGSSETLQLEADEDVLETHRRKAGTYEIPRPFVSTLEDIRLCGMYPVPFTRDGKIVSEAVGKPRLLLVDIIASVTAAESRRQLRTELYGSGVEPARTIDTAVLLYHKWSDGYTHWLQDTITRLEGIKQYEDRAGERPKLLLGPDPSWWQFELLELLGYDESDYVYWDGEPTWVEKMVVPSCRRYEIPSLKNLEWLRSEILGRVDVDTDRFSDRIYVSRHDAGRRLVVNESEVMNLLSKNGFERYLPTEMTVEEQIALFNQADVVVGPAGANLSNVLFSSNIQMIEFSGDLPGRSRYALCELLDHSYRALSVTPVGIDMEVELAELRNVIEGYCL